MCLSIQLERDVSLQRNLSYFIFKLLMYLSAKKELANIIC